MNHQPPVVAMLNDATGFKHKLNEDVRRLRHTAWNSNNVESVLNDTQKVVQSNSPLNPC